MIWVQEGEIWHLSAGGEQLCYTSLVFSLLIIIIIHHNYWILLYFLFLNCFYLSIKLFFISLTYEVYFDSSPHSTGSGEKGIERAAVSEWLNVQLGLIHS